MNEADEMHKKYYSDDYKRGFKDGKIHRESSIPTLNKFDNMSEEITNIKVALEGQSVTIGGIEAKINDMRESDERLTIKMDAFISKANDDYATKDNLGRLEKKFWIALTTLLGVLGTVIFFLVDFIVEKLIA